MIPVIPVLIVTIVLGAGIIVGVLASEGKDSEDRD